MHVVPKPTLKPLPQLRRETAERAAENYNREILEKIEDPIICHDELVNLLEESMLSGEQRGIQTTLDFLAEYVNIQRKKYASGPANHVNQAVHAMLRWLEQNKSLKLFPREEKQAEDAKVEEDRNFIGMPKKE